MKSKTRRTFEKREALYKLFSAYADHAYNWDIDKEGDIDSLKDGIDYILEKDDDE